MNPHNQHQSKAGLHLPPCRVKVSMGHGRGVFACQEILAGDCIAEYQGERIEREEALRRADAKGGPVNHTFF